MTLVHKTLRYLKQEGEERYAGHVVFRLGQGAVGLLDVDHVELHREQRGGAGASEPGRGSERPTC